MLTSTRKSSKQYGIKKLANGKSRSKSMALSRRTRRIYSSTELAFSSQSIPSPNV